MTHPENIPEDGIVEDFILPYEKTKNEDSTVQEIKEFMQKNKQLHAEFTHQREQIARRKPSNR